MTFGETIITAPFTACFSYRKDQHALKKLNKNSFDLVLMDCQMPLMGDNEATRMNDHIAKPLVVHVLYRMLLQYLSPRSERQPNLN